MERREFISLVGSVAVWPLAARAQQAGKVWRIGFLSGASRSAVSGSYDALVPEELVYQLVKAVFENQPRLVKATSAASDTLPQNVVKDTFLPFHPGAVRYYREIGIKIPDELAPTN